MRGGSVVRGMAGIAAVLAGLAMSGYMLGIAAGPGRAPGDEKKGGTVTQYTGPQSFDVLQYRLDLRFAMTTPEMGGAVTMTLLPTRGLDTLTLHAGMLQIDSVRVNGVRASFTVDAAGERFQVLPGRTVGAGETLRVAVDYRRLAGPARPSGRQGYYWFSDTIPGVEATLGYTMSEPSDARFWMPCYDEPWDKATAEIHATVPAGYMAASNGRLLGSTSNTDGSVTWHWQESHQVATYLLAVTISQWAVPTMPFVRAPGDTIPLQYYVWQADSARCAGYLPTLRQMVATLSTRFGPYPFEKYGMTGVFPFGFGGMEHTTITTMARSTLTSEAVVVHELAHQWWGDLVTCGTWRDIWLNESFASYAEALWRESLGGAAELKRYMRQAHERFGAGSWTGAIYDPEGQGFGLFSSSVYSKGAWVLHMLRGVVGDSLFFKSLRDYRAKYQEGAAVTEEFRAVVDMAAGRDMAWFFGQWIYGEGWPRYALQFRHAADTLSLTIYQTQSYEWPTFTMPMQVRAYLRGGRDTSFTVLDSARIQAFRIRLAEAPDSVVLDPDAWILKQITAPPTDIADNGAGPLRFDLEQNFPNPFNPSTTLAFQVPAAGIVQLAVYDVLGREVARPVNGPMAAGRHTVVFDGSALASGVYMYQLTVTAAGAGPAAGSSGSRSGAEEGSQVAVRKMVLMK